MDNDLLTKQLREYADGMIGKDVLVADALYRISEYLSEKATTGQGNLSFFDFGTTFAVRTRIKCLVNVLLQLAELYQSSIPPKQLAYVNDLIDKIGVGYLEEGLNDSGHADQLRDSGYRLSAKDSEVSLQVRIANLLNELMPRGSYIVE